MQCTRKPSNDIILGDKNVSRFLFYFKNRPPNARENLSTSNLCSIIHKSLTVHESEFNLSSLRGHTASNEFCVCFVSVQKYDYAVLHPFDFANKMDVKRHTHTQTVEINQRQFSCTHSPKRTVKLQREA